MTLLLVTMPYFRWNCMFLNCKVLFVLADKITFLIFFSFSLFILLREPHEKVKNSMFLGSLVGQAHYWH